MSTISELDELREFLKELKKKPKTTSPMLITRREYQKRIDNRLGVEGFAVFEDFVDRNKKHCPQAAAAVRRMKRDDHGSL